MSVAAAGWVALSGVICASYSLPGLSSVNLTFRAGLSEVTETIFAVASSAIAIWITFGAGCSPGCQKTTCGSILTVSWMLTCSLRMVGCSGLGVVGSIIVFS